MNRIRTGSLLFGGLLTALLLFSNLEGAIESPRVAPDRSLYYALLLPLATGLVVGLGYLRHWQVFFRFRWPIVALFGSALLAAIFRDGSADSLRNAIGFGVNYYLIGCICVVAFGLPFRRALAVLVHVVALIYLPLTVCMHLKMFGALALFPDRDVNNDLRLGGVTYYAHTAMILAVGGIFALRQLLTAPTRGEQLRYVALFGLLNVFLLFTDCRSAWGGACLAYVGMAYPHLSLRKRVLAGVAGLFLLPAGLLTKEILAKRVQTSYNTESDFAFRQRIWQFALESIAKRPLTGYGQRSEQAFSYKAMADLGDELIDPHSATISLAVQSGLLTVLAFFWLYGGIARLAWRHALGPNKAMLVLPLFWLFVPLFWAHIYNGGSDFMQLLFPITYFVGLLHPDLYRPQAVLHRPVSTLNAVVHYA